MTERFVPQFERVYHDKPALIDGALTWYGLHYLANHSYNPFYSLARGGRSDLIIGIEPQIRSLSDHISTAPIGSLATISGPFGSGKTAFIYALLDELSTRGIMKPEEIHRIVLDDLRWSDVSGLDSVLSSLTTFGKDRYVNTEETPPKLVIIEEIDRSEKEQHENAFLLAELIRRDLPFLIITGGSATLKDPNFFELMEVSSDQVYQVEMVPPTPESLKEVLKRDFAFLFGDNTPEFNPDRLFDPEFLDRALPNTHPPITTFREALSRVSDLAKSLRYPKDSSDEHAFIDGNFYREFVKPTNDYVKDRLDIGFLIRLQELINSTYNPAVPFEALNFEQLTDLGFDEGIEGDIDIRKRNKKLKNHHQFLIEVDVSALTDKPESERRFLPTARTFLDARYNPIDSDSHTESGF